jgi:hypothetical protein
MAEMAEMAEMAVAIHATFGASTMVELRCMGDDD